MLRYNPAPVATPERRTPSWRVREATPGDHAAVRAGMGVILRETEGQKSAGFGRELWEWQYLRPAHPSLIVVADDGGTLAGHLHAVLLDMRYGGRPVLGAMLNDGATQPAYRKQGVLRAMDDYMRERLAARGVELVLGIPNDRSLHGFTGHGAYQVVTRVPVYVRPLDFGRVIASRLPLGPLATMLGAVAGPVYRALRVRRPAPIRAQEMGPIERFDDAIDLVSREFGAAVHLHLERSARYLNWRFLDKPTREYTAWSVHRAGRPCAYLVTRHAPLFGVGCLALMDFGCRAGEEDALLGLVAARLDAERAAGAEACVVMGLHPFMHRLEQLGFVRVPDRWNPRRFHFIARGLTSAIGADLLDPASWLVTLADWDVL